MKSLTRLGRALRTIRFYKWAFGALTAADSDLGMVAEYLVGEILDCLPPGRKVVAPFDLETKSGVSLEVKSTSKPYVRKGRNPYYRWDISTQVAAIAGKRPLADVWLFLIADFPSASADILDYDHWRCYLAVADQARTFTVKQYLSESALKKLGLVAFPLAELKTRFAKL